MSLFFAIALIKMVVTGRRLPVGPAVLLSLGPCYCRRVDFVGLAHDSL